MSNSKNDYVPLIRRNANGKEIEKPIVSEEFYHRYFFNRPVGPGLDPLPRISKVTKLTKVPKVPKAKSSAGLNTVEMPHTTISSIQVYPAFPTPLQPSKINLSNPVTPYTNLQLSNTPIALTPYQAGKKGGRKTRKNKNKKNKKSRKHLRK
uniref:Uncharacterized protein n=1 Tax=viral metagenome TaxID=1070528 RepID=A0A6C0ANI8_9ZZZZ